MACTALTEGLIQIKARCPGRHVMAGMQDTSDSNKPSTRQEELRSFLFFTVVMAPALAFAVVGTYGLLVWMYQLLVGPPGS